jgi:hypothetical protein
MPGLREPSEGTEETYCWAIFLLFLLLQWNGMYLNQEYVGETWYYSKVKGEVVIVTSAALGYFEAASETGGPHRRSSYYITRGHLLFFDVSSIRRTRIMSN